MMSPILRKPLASAAIFIIAFTWVFSGWPRITFLPSFPPPIQEARAAAAFVDSNGTAGSLSTTVDIGTAGTDRVVAVFAGSEAQSGTALSGVTVDGKACHSVATAYNTNSLGNRTELWYCDDDDLGSSNGSVTAAITGTGLTAGDWAVQAIVYSGVDQSGPNDSGIDNSSVDPATTTSVPNIDVSAGGVVVMGAHNGSGGIAASSYTSPLTEQTAVDPSSADGVSASGIESSAQTNKTYTLTWSSAPNRSSGVVASWDEAVSNLPPAAPTLGSVPFDNEQTGDSTPDFEFTASDPDGTADITYQMEIDDDSAFGSLLVNCESDTSCAAGAGSFTRSGDSDPFTEGQAVTFTPTTSLTTDTTYYWRVRAKDVSGSGGSGSYGSWSGMRSVTYVSGTDPSEWFQTTDEQFDTGTLTDTQTSGSDSVFLGGGAGFDQTDTFNSYTSDLDCTQRPTFGNWTSVNGSDGTNGWTTDINTTASGSTGPSGANDGAYLYLETSASSQTCGADATFSSSQYVESNTIDASAYAFSFEFVYNMTGATMDTGPASLHIDAWNGSSWDLDAPGSAVQSGQQASWTAAGPYDLSSYTNADFKIRIRYVMSSGGTVYQNDVAVDDLHIYGDARSASSGTVTSPVIDFDSVSGQDGWGELQWSADETNGSVSMRVLGSNGSDCDTQVIASTTANPLDLSGLTSTGGGELHNRLCVEATLTDSGGTPYLNDWTVTWATDAGAVSMDIVDGGGSSVGSPSVAMTSIPLSLSFQTATGTLGVSGERIRVTNSSANPQWTLGMAASSTTAFWDGSTTDYDFNDPTASAGDGGDADSLGGQMTVDASGATITPQGGCSATGLTLGNSASFSEGVTDSITLLTAGGSADTSCYWDMTGVDISQSIPASQDADLYSMDMILTVTAI